MSISWLFDVYAPAQIVTAPAQLIIAPAQSPATRDAVYSALLFSNSLPKFNSITLNTNRRPDGRKE